MPQQWNHVANVSPSVADCFCPIADREKKHLSRWDCLQLPDAPFGIVVTDHAMPVMNGFG